MAKIAFSKMGLKKLDNVTTVNINDVNIEVKQYLPIADKINIVTNVLQMSADDNNFANPMKVEVYTNLEIIYAYTNLNFTEKQKEDVTKLYDLLEENDIFTKIIAMIPENEYLLLINWIDETIKAYYAYRNSAFGIMEQITSDYKNLDMDASQIQQKLANGENVEFLKEVMTKLG